ncbi:potassium channel family protein [Desertibaculum subflavum]|uniref:potassium channel family protein n=1 Tax=Desertibaculum subflavum TaxID=2268458 RepID=UPI000E662C4D
MLAFFFRLRGQSGRYRTFVAQGNRRFARLALYLVLILIAHVAAMMLLEGLPLFDAVWLTATTVVTVGYGDFFAKTVEGRIATMVLLYAGAIFVLAKAVNDLIELKTEQADRKLRGAWRWNMQDHILVIGSPDRHATAFFERLVESIRETPDIATKSIQLLTTCYGEQALPRVLGDLGVVHWSGAAGDREALSAVNAKAAHAVLVLARAQSDPACDGETFDTVDRLVQAGCTAPIVAECVDDTDRTRLRRAGARSIVRPMRAYPGMLVRALVAPGSEAIIEDLFTVKGDECRRVELAAPWRGEWTDLVMRLVGGGIGTPLAFQDAAGKVHMNPVDRKAVEAAALFVVTHEGQHDAAERVRRALA